MRMCMWMDYIPDKIQTLEIQQFIDKDGNIDLLSLLAQRRGKEISDSWDRSIRELLLNNSE